MKKNMFLYSVLLAGTMSLPSYAQNSPPSSQLDKANEKIGREIIFGQSGGFSGDTKAVSEAVTLGAQAYFNYVNKNGGIFGRQLKIITRDDAYNAAKAKENTIKFIAEDNVFALYGYATIATARAALPLATDYKIPFLAAFTGNGGVRTPYNRQVVNIRASHNAELSAITEHLSSFNTKKFVFSCYTDSTANIKDMKSVMQDYPGVKMTPITMERNESDLEKVTTAIAKENPEAVVVVMTAASIKKFHDSLRKKGINAPIYATSFAGTNAVMDALGDAGYGVVISQVMPAPWNRSVQIVQEYQEIFKTSYPNIGFTYESFESYVSAKVLVEALRRAGPELTREKFLLSVESLYETDFGGFIVSFGPQDHEGSTWVELTMVGKNKKVIY